MWDYRFIATGKQATNERSKQAPKQYYSQAIEEPKNVKSI